MESKLLVQHYVLNALKIIKYEILKLRLNKTISGAEL